MSGMVEVRVKVRGSPIFALVALSPFTFLTTVGRAPLMLASTLVL